MSASFSPADGALRMLRQPLRILHVIEGRPLVALPELDDRLAHAEPADVVEVDEFASYSTCVPPVASMAVCRSSSPVKIHQAPIVRVSLIELEHRELRIVMSGDALVAEVAIDLVDALKPADHQPLQIQLRRDAEIEIDVQRIVMRHERPRRRAAVERLHHRSLHFQEAACFQLPPERGDHFAARHEHLAHLRIGDQVQIALAVTGLHIFQAVPLFGHGQQGLRQEVELLHVYAEFAGRVRNR